MTFTSVDVPERSERRLSEVKGRESEEGRDSNQVCRLFDYFYIENGDLIR